MDVNSGEEERSTKRPRLLQPDEEKEAEFEQQPVEDQPMKDVLVQDQSLVTNTDVEEQVAKELRAGISAYVSPDSEGFSGVLKQRQVD